MLLCPTLTLTDRNSENMKAMRVHNQLFFSGLNPFSNFLSTSSSKGPRGFDVRCCALSACASDSKERMGGTNLDGGLVEVLLVGRIVGTLAGPWGRVHLLARRPLGRGRLTALRHVGGEI